MIADLKPYPWMKDSGVEWLGEMPEHWAVRKLRNVLHSVTERDCPDLPLLSVVRERGVILRDISSKQENRNFIPDDLTNYKVVRRDQFAMNKMKAWQGSYGVSQHNGIVSPAYFVFDVDGVGSDYFHTSIRSKAYVPFFTQASDGVRIGQWDLSQARMREIPFVVPPLKEQAAIVRFLDQVDRWVRRYVRTKRKLVELLKEQKQAVIHRAVTRGLDPNVRLKPSGVEWLGEIPTTFKRAKLGRLCVSVRDGTHNPPPAVSGVHRLLSVRNIVNGEFVTRFDDRTMTAEAFAELQRSYTVRAGDVVLALVGATTGKSAVVGEIENVTVQRSIGILRPNPSVLDSRFLNLVVSSELVQSQIREIMDKYAAQPGIYLADVSSLQLVFPELDTQRIIVDAVRRQTIQLDGFIDAYDREIELLREFHTRLVADVVTGKLDVREEAASSLPEEPEDLEPVDTDDSMDDGSADELDTLPEEAEL